MQAKKKSTPLILLITDAEDHSETAIQALKTAVDAGIAVLPIGLGSLQGAPVPSFGSGSAYMKDEQGELVRSSRNDALLQAIW